MPDAVPGQQLMKIIDSRRWLVVKTNDDITFPKPGSPCRTVGFEGNDENSALDCQIVVPHDSPRQRDVLSSETYVAPAHLAVANQPTCHKFGGVDRNSKGDAPRRENHSGVHTNDLATRIHQRPTRIARIERG